MMSETEFLPLIIAHRGASAVTPENTIAAFQQAIADGADGLEFDVRITKNGVPIVFHDSTLRRVANQNVRISNLTSEELGKLDAGSWFNERNPNKANPLFSREIISTFEDILDFVKDYQGLIYVELKGAAAEISPLVEAVAKIISRSNLLPNIIIKSFKLEAIRQIKTLVPEVKTAALFAPKIMTILQSQNRLIEKAQENKADELSLHFSLATQKLVDKAEEEGISTIIWTADHPVWVKRASEIGIKAIITNNPARLLAKRHEIFRKTSIFAY